MLDKKNYTKFYVKFLILTFEIKIFKHRSHHININFN